MGYICHLDTPYQRWRTPQDGGTHQLLTVYWTGNPIYYDGNDFRNEHLGKAVSGNEKAQLSSSYLRAARKVVLFITTSGTFVTEKEWTLFHTFILDLVHSLSREFRARLSAFKAMKEMIVG